MSQSRPITSIPEEIIPLNAEKIIVVGDGPMALAKAISLKQQGLDVSLVGTRFDKFTRSGDHAAEFVTEELSKLIYPEKIIDMPSRHIKDLERQLYDIVKKLNIFIYEDYLFCDYVISEEKTDKKWIEIENQTDHSRKRIPADLVYDCTGTARACLNALNKIKKDTFIFQEIPGIYPFSAQVRVLFTQKEYDILKTYILNEFKIKNSLIYALGREKLQALGWKYFRLPFFYGNAVIFNKKEDSHKVNIYLEIPEELMEKSGEKKDPAITAKIYEFTQIMLMIIRGDSTDLSLPPLKIHKETKKINIHKPMISSFPVKPVYTTPAFFLGNENLPATFHAGDCSLNMPFFTAHGITDGANREYELKPAFVIEQHAIRGIKPKQYQHTYKELTDKSIILMYSQNHTVRTADITEEQARIHYQKAYEECSEEDKRKLRPSLEKLNFIKLISLRAPLEALSFDNPYAIHNSSIFLENNSKLFMFDFTLSLLNTEDKNILRQIQESYVQKCKQLGNVFAKPPSFSAAKATKYYYLALNTLRNLQHPNVAEEIRVISNLILVQKNNIDEVILLANQVFENCLPKLESSFQEQKEDKIHETLQKVLHHKTVALIKKADNLLSKNPIEEDRVKKIISEIEQNIVKIPYPAKPKQDFAALKNQYPDFFSQMVVETLNVQSLDINRAH